MEPIHMGWFQVNCPRCDAALQVEMAAGVRKVRCCDTLPCGAVFEVNVPPEALPPAPPETMRAKRARQFQERGSRQRPPKLVAYNLHMKLEMKRLYALKTGASKQEIFKAAAAVWKDSPLHPDNAPAVDDAIYGR